MQSICAGVTWVDEDRTHLIRTHTERWGGWASFFPGFTFLYWPGCWGKSLGSLRTAGGTRESCWGFCFLWPRGTISNHRPIHVRTYSDKTPKEPLMVVLEFQKAQLTWDLIFQILFQPIGPTPKHPSSVMFPYFHPVEICRSSCAILVSLGWDLCSLPKLMFLLCLQNLEGLPPVLGHLHTWSFLTWHHIYFSLCRA